MEVLMNRRILTVTIATAAMLVLISLITGCGQPSTAATEPSAALEGEKFENDNFSIMVPAGWRKVEDPMTVQIIDDEVALDSIAIAVDGSPTSPYKPDWAKKRVDESVKAYNASTPKEVSAFGKTWWKTTYTAFDTYKTQYSRVTDDGYLVEVTLSGKDHESNEKLKAVQDTLVFKR
jgi:hypothetical protein